jgi:hypothetical protein
MFRVASAFVLLAAISAPALADGMDYPRYHHYRRIYLPPERHVVEKVSPPWSANFLINGTRFTGYSPACFRWAAGERIKLIAGDWNGNCVQAVFYNYYRHSTCEMRCGSW